MSDDEVRQPNWENWSDTIKAEVWAAVALSFDIEPRTIPDLDFGWRDGPFDACPGYFRERLEIACNHIENGELQAEWGGATPFRKVKLVDFSEWASAASRKWQLPSRFPRGLKQGDDDGGESARTHKIKQETEPDRSGGAGRPTSWHLVKQECQRRYAEGTRHVGTGGESPSAWADELMPWLESTYPKAPRMTKKTLTNQLSPLLRGLQLQD
jgi:hypothetical protein